MTSGAAAVELHRELSLVYLAVDQLNTSCAHLLWKGQQAISPTDLVLQSFNKLGPDVREWLPPSEVRTLFCECGVIPAVDVDVLGSLLECIAYPARASFAPGPMAPRGKWTLKGGRHLPPPPGDEEMFEHLYIRRTGGVYSFTTADNESNLAAAGPPELTVKERRLRLFDEFLDPLAAARMYLARVHKVPELEVGHHIQRWIVATFGLPNEQEFRFALAHVCDRVNEMFFGHAHPSHSVLATRGATLGTAFLVHEITRLLTAGSAPSDLSTTHKRAIGIYLFLRLRRLVRFRYQFLSDVLEVAAGHKHDPQVASLEVRAAHRRQAVSMLRPLEYTFLQTAIFGIQTGIQGLNFVLRGGLLPRREAGRTFVITGPAGCGKTLLGLQLLCDIASKGGLGVYCSFEEDYDSIAERLVTFDLLRPGFRILLGSDEPLDTLQREAEHPCGTLLFYRVEAGETMGVGALVAELAKVSRYTQRALVLDSLNALTYGNSDSADDLRRMLYGLIRAVEKEHFFGFLLSEADDPRLNVAPYIADTLIELSPASKGQMRRMEVRKCRTQDYHRGPHPYHLAERKGVVVYPSLGAVRDTIRRRVSATLSEHRAIRLPPMLGEGLGVTQVEEKSSMLISGAPEASVLLFALQLLTEPPQATARAEGRAAGREKMNVNSVLVVSFNTPEVRFNQMLRGHPELSKRWSGIAQTQLRWYSPGGSLTGDQIMAELRQYILRGRRYGSPIERVLFYEVELAEQLLPSLVSERLFWPTVLQLLNTEAVTALFVIGDAATLHPTTMAAIEAEVDYAFHFSHTPPEDGRGAPGAAYAPEAVEADEADRPTYSPTGYVQTHRVPRLVPDLVGRYASVQMARNGLIE